MTLIMVVDDEPEICDIVRNELLKEGYAVDVANSGDECLEKIKKNKPELILLDVMMPEMDGWEVCRRIKEDDRTKDILVSMLTVKYSDEHKLKSLDEALADWHITKPIERDKLKNTVKWLLERHIKGR